MEDCALHNAGWVDQERREMLLDAVLQVAHTRIV